VTATDPVAQLMAPGAPFEIVIEDVVGHPTQVYKTRMKSMRELMTQNEARQADFLRINLRCRGRWGSR